MTTLTQLTSLNEKVSQSAQVTFQVLQVLLQQGVPANELSSHPVFLQVQSAEQEARLAYNQALETLHS